MYVCTCHGVRARQIEAAVQAGAKTAKAALEMCGHRPQCARCCSEIAEQIRRGKAQAKAAYAVAAE
jgi:bacterioferritin-associated ferredoxin